jgi:fatty-acyl-CoA synthase
VHRPEPVVDPAGGPVGRSPWPTHQQLVLTALGRNQDTPVLVDDQVRWTGRELRAHTAQLAHALGRAGVGRGGRVALLGGNSAAFAATQLACAVAGAAYTGFHQLAPAEELGAGLATLGADALVFDPTTSGQAVDRLLTAGAGRDHAYRLLSFGPHPGADDLLALAAAEEPELDAVPVDEADPASISWTGGTTGRSKGVVRSQRAMAWMTMLMMAEWDWPRPLRFVAAGPLSHAAGSMVPAVLMRGGTVLVRPRFDVEDLLAVIEAERATATFLVPTMIYRLLDHPATASADLSSLLLVIYGASPISPVRLNEAIHRLGPIFMQLYGQVEAPNCITALPIADHIPDDLTRLASCGRPLAGLQVSLLDPAGQPVGPGAIGEVCVQGPLVMDGYLDEPEATAEALRDGWLHTGDLAVVDADGYLTLVDRAKDMIVTGGFNVYPREVEDILATDPTVAAAAVIGVPDDDWGEAVAAYVVAAPGADVDVEGLRALVRSTKGPVHTPKAVYLVDALPLTPVGKPDKKALRARHWSAGGRAVH